jgi:hypothetical protein
VGPTTVNEPPPAEMLRDIRNLLNIGQAIYRYAADHDGRLPESLGETLAYIERWSDWTADLQPQATLAERARLYLSMRDLVAKQVPELPTPEWVDANTSYIYLGRAGRQPPAEEWGRTVIAHVKLDDGHVVVGPDQNRVAVFPAVMLDGHVESELKAHTARGIAESETRLAATLG